MSRIAFDTLKHLAGVVGLAALHAAYFAPMAFICTDLSGQEQHLAAWLVFGGWMLGYAVAMSLALAVLSRPCSDRGASQADSEV